MTYQCYYEEKGIRCPERQEDFWCSPNHEQIWKSQNYIKKKSGFTKLLDPKFAKQQLIRRGYIILTPLSFERFILTERFEKLKAKGYIAQRNGHWFYSKEHWRSAVQMLAEWREEDRKSKQQVIKFE